jgi:alanine racemase
VKSIANDTTRAWVDIDLGALLRNGEALARQARVPLVPMVKADAYGLGAVPVARALETLSARALWGFGVATVEEGRELRDAGITRRIIVFTPVIGDDLAAARALAITPALGDRATIAAWTALGGDPWHLAIDTGMSRAGVRWDAVGALADALADALTDVLHAHSPEGAFTHFHSSEMDDGTRDVQETRFREALAALPVRPSMLHTENSGAIARRSPSPWTLVRPGVFLYGVGSGAAAQLQPEPVAHLRAKIVDLRDVHSGESVSYGATWTAERESRIATLGIGYADGYRRSLGNRGRALLNGTSVPVVGNVTMDMTMLDVTDAPCAIGDTVTLMGVDGNARITAEDVGAACGLSPYEILTGLRSRITRRYV